MHKDVPKYKKESKDSLTTPNLLPFLALNHGNNFWFIPGVLVSFLSATIFAFMSVR